MLLTVLLICLFAAARHDGPVRRWLVELPAQRLAAMTPRNAVALVLLLAIMPFAGQILLPEMAWILALDLAAWVEVGLAVTVMARLAPAWKGLKASAARLVRQIPRFASRARRAPTARRRPAKSPAPEDGWAFA
ncbi:hypothetical protein [Caulobacter endophyticus]|uniref:Uncharacterized protein n=1 Tax=Caulobacter endophyticus TaxID=2172652 RepID=A0A2T9K2U2_9CAUL|nr:hypothetical protein [Caulobacter endophyticus]PVM90290.1 hypothetical protein DDF67_10190 [Caulobacter endophyticus]